jgi:hypothetical protein
MITLDTLTLPNELIWMDEYAWYKTRSHEKLSLSGVRNVFESQLPFTEVMIYVHLVLSS